MRLLTAILGSILFVTATSGCFLAHELDGDEEMDSSPDPVPDPIPPGPGPAPFPDPGPERDYCEPPPPPDEACPCGYEGLVHPDESGECAYCRECASCQIPIAEDGPLFSNARIVWQAPGGFSGLGPAVVITGDGLVRIWREIAELAPGSMPTIDPDVVMALPFYEVDQLVLRWQAADLTSIPHDGPLVDCYPYFSVRPCEGCPVERVDYATDVGITPELECVLDWFDTRLTEAGVRGRCDL